MPIRSVDGAIRRYGASRWGQRMGPVDGASRYQLQSVEGAHDTRYLCRPSLGGYRGMRLRLNSIAMHVKRGFVPGCLAKKYCVT